MAPTRLLSFDFVFLLAPRQYSSKLDIALGLASVGFAFLCLREKVSKEDDHRIICISQILLLPLHPKFENGSFVILIGGCSTIVAMLDKMTG